jgi:hypothetical protein
LNFLKTFFNDLISSKFTPKCRKIFCVFIRNTLLQFRMVNFLILQLSNTFLINFIITITNCRLDHCFWDSKSFDQKKSKRPYFFDDGIHCIIDEGWMVLSWKITGFEAGWAILFKRCETVKNAKVFHVALKIFTFYLWTYHFFMEDLKREVSKMILNHFYYLSNVLKILFGHLIFVKTFLNPLNLNC